MTRNIPRLMLYKKQIYIVILYIKSPNSQYCKKNARKALIVKIARKMNIVIAIVTVKRLKIN